jgi:ATP-dependent protease ClpP protease subunit
MKPTVEMAEEAQRGLAWRAEYNRGGTAVGVARARDIVNGENLSPETIRRMVSYFARHEVDKEGQGFKQGEEGYPSAGRIAWALWGGDAGQVWANDKAKQLETQNSMIEIENKAAKVKLNDHVDKFSVDKLIDDIAKVYGMKAVENAYAFGEIIACADNAVDTLEVEIHSGGGSVFEGYRIFNEMKKLRERGVYVTARINTLAASMGSVIAMAADKVEIASNGKIMIHEASGGAQGDSETLLRYAELLENISDEIAGIYSEKTNRDKDDIRRLMKKETWMTAEQAIEMGFADEIFDTNAKAMSILDKFRPDAALTEKVQGLEASLQSADNTISEMTAAMIERTTDLENALGELGTIKAQLDEITAERDTLTASLAEAQNKVAELEASIVEASTSAEARAAEIVAQAGIAPLDVSADEQPEELNAEQLRAKIDAIADPKARMEARLKNWDKLNSH